MKQKIYGLVIPAIATLILIFFVPFCFAFADTVPAVIDSSTQQSTATETQSQQAQAQSTSQQTTSSTSTTTDNLNSQTTAVTSRIDISDGVPVVTTDQATAKVNRITMELHRLFVSVAPMVTIAVLTIGGLLFFFCKSARSAVVWAIIGLIVVTWSIPIVGYILQLVNA